MKKVWYTLLGCWIRRARHSGLWQVKSGHPGKGNCQLSQDNFAPDLTNYILEGKRIRAMLTLLFYCESGGGNSSDNDNGDDSNNDDDDDDDDAVLQATVLVAMVSKKNLVAKIAVKVANLVTCDRQSRAKLFPRNFLRFCEICFPIS